MKIFMKVFCFSFVSLFAFINSAHSSEVNMIRITNWAHTGLSANLVIHGPNNRIHRYSPVEIRRSSNTSMGVAIQGDITVVVQSVETTQGEYRKFEFKKGECFKRLTNYWGGIIIEPIFFELFTTDIGEISCRSLS